MIYDIALFVLSVAIAAHLIILHRAPWVLIAAYWAVNAIRNGKKVKEDADD